MRKFGFTFLLLTIILSLLSGFNFTNAQAQSAPEAVGGVFNDNSVAPGEVIEVPIEIRDVEDLYAMDIELLFDPTILHIEVADPNTEGVQVAIGTFLDAGLVLYNTVDNTNGVIHFVMTQVNPSEGKTGSGVVLVIYVRGSAVGTCELAVTFLELASRAGEAIPASGHNATIEVIESYVPVESTPIPVQDPDAVVVIPTSQATAIPTPTVMPTIVAVEKTSDEVSGAPIQETAETDSLNQEIPEEKEGTDQPQFNLFNYWWAFFLILGGAVLLVILQARSRH